MLTVGFTPVPNDRLSHMIVIGCRSPAASPPKDQDVHAPIWEYGSNYHESAAPINSTKGICSNGEDGPFLFQYALGDPPFHLPEGVGVPVGGDSSIQFLLLTIHFHETRDATQASIKTDAGAIICMAPAASHIKPAGVMKLQALGSFPKGKTTKAEVACHIRSDIEMHVFAFHVHGHGISKVISGWKVDAKNGSWSLIGKLNPQLPTFYRPAQPGTVVIRRGDAVASRCTVYNTRDHEVFAG